MWNVRKRRLFRLPFFTGSLRLPAGSPQWGALSESCRLSVNLRASQSLPCQRTNSLFDHPVHHPAAWKVTPARSRPGHSPALQANGSWLLRPQTRAMPRAFPIFAQSLSGCSCLAADKHLIGRGNEQRWSCLGMKAEDSCLTKSFLKHTSLRDHPAAIFFVALTRKRSDYRVAVWLSSLQLTTKQLAEKKGFKQLLLSGHKQDVCYAGCKPQTK